MKKKFVFLLAIIYIVVLTGCVSNKKIKENEAGAIKIFQDFGYKYTENAIDLGAMLRNTGEQRMKKEFEDFWKNNPDNSKYTPGGFYDLVQFETNSMSTILSNQIDRVMYLINKYSQFKQGHLYKVWYLDKPSKGYNVYPCICFYWSEDGNASYFAFDIYTIKKK